MQPTPPPANQATAATARLLAVTRPGSAGPTRSIKGGKP